MNVRKILLAIDGSIYSQQAAEVAWAIAKRTDASVTALHVLDTAAVLTLIGSVDSGFLDAADFKEERNAIVSAMTSAGNTLIHQYAESARKHGLEVHAVVETGDAFGVIEAYSREADLVVIGHKPNEDGARSRHVKSIMRLSLAEYMAENLSVPLLVVQGPRASWKSMTVTTSLEHINKAYIDQVVGFARQLNIQPALVCFSTTDIEEAPPEVVTELRSSDGFLAEVPIAVASTDLFRTRRFDEWDNPVRDTAWDDWDATMLAIPTRPVPGRRLTVADGSPARVVRYAMAQAMLFYPEEIAARLDAASPVVANA